MRWMLRGMLLVLAVLGVVERTFAQGTVDAYMRIDGGGLTLYGDSTFPGYERWIRLDGGGFSAQYVPGMPNLMGMPDRIDGSVWVSGQIVWGQANGEAADRLIAMFGAATTIPFVTIEWVDDAAGAPTSTRWMVYKDLTLTGYGRNAGSAIFGGIAAATMTGGWSVDSGGQRVREAGKTYDAMTGSVIANFDYPSIGAGLGSGNLSAAAAVPEPHAWMTMLAGFGLLLVKVGRRAGAPR